MAPVTAIAAHCPDDGFTVTCNVPDAENPALLVGRCPKCAREVKVNANGNAAGHSFGPVGGVQRVTETAADLGGLSRREAQDAIQEAFDRDLVVRGVISQSLLDRANGTDAPTELETPTEPTIDRHVISVVYVPTDGEPEYHGITVTAVTATSAYTVQRFSTDDFEADLQAAREAYPDAEDADSVQAYLSARTVAQAEVPDGEAPQPEAE